MAIHRRSIRPPALLVLITAALTVAACTSDSSGDGSGSGNSVDSLATGGMPASPGGSASPDSAGPVDGTFAGTVAPTAGGERDGVATLLAVRAASQPTSAVERVVFEFDGDSVPRYEIGYAQAPFTQCGSGQPVSMAGDAVLRVRLRATRAHAESSGGDIRPTVTERDRTLDQPLLRQLTLTCDFEAEVEWLLGVSARRPYRVQELASPARLVVDLSNRE